MADSNKIAHLGMIEGVISRLAGNGFTIKGWAVTLTTAVLAYVSKDGVPRAALLALVPVFGFALLDSFYLMWEHQARELYKNCAARRDCPTYSLSMTMPKEAGGKSGWRLFLACFLSPGVVTLYSILFIAVLLVAVFGSQMQPAAKAASGTTAAGPAVVGTTPSK